MIDWITEAANWYMTGLMGVILYWVPVAICLWGYTLRNIEEVREDKKKRQEYLDHQRSYYNPSVTTGTLLGRYIVSFVPVLNLGICAFDLLWEILEGFFIRIAAIFNRPLVPEKERDEEKPKEK